MTVFKVHYEIDNSRIIMPVNAGTPDEAANIIRKRAPGAIVTKVKVDKSGNVSPRAGKRLINAAQGMRKSFGQRIVDITDRLAEAVEAETPDYWDDWATEDLSNHH